MQRSLISENTAKLRVDLKMSWLAAARLHEQRIAVTSPEASWREPGDFFDFLQGRASCRLPFFSGAHVSRQHLANLIADGIATSSVNVNKRVKGFQKNVGFVIISPSQDNSAVLALTTSLAPILFIAALSK